MEADGSVTLMAAPPAPAGVRFVAGEDVLLLAVAMPEMSAAQRRAAVGFAVEDLIARPLDEVHVVLGPAVAERWLVAVIGRDVLEALPAAAKARLVPDVLAVPVPEAGQWSVWAGPSRVLVRTADGAGFAAAMGALPYFHLAAGRPGIVLYGGVLDAQFSVLRPAVLPTQLEASLQRFDLSMGGAARGMTLPRAWRQMAAVVVLAGLGHLWLLATDTWALGRVRDDSALLVRDALQAMGQ
ncbi:MAG: type II secretion system protein GspL, partial [Paracoccaceae bacterium]